MLYLAIVSIVGLYACKSANSLSNDEPTLQISPGGDQHKHVGKGTILTCSWGSQVVGTNPEWRGPSGELIENTRGRIYVEPWGVHGRRLYFTNITEADAGTYTCHAGGGHGAAAATVRLTVLADITFADTPTLVAAEPGRAALLPCEPRGRATTVTWRHDHHKLVPDGIRHIQESNGLRVVSVVAEDAGIYECRAEVESQGILKVRHITLNVLYPPTIVQAPVSANIVQGHPLNLTCLAKGSPRVKIEWYREQKMSKMIKIKVQLESQSNQYSITRMASKDVGRYFCKAINSLGHDEAYADINMMVPPSIHPMPEEDVLEGRTVIISCQADGDPRPLITWSRDGQGYSDGASKSDVRVSIDNTQIGTTKIIIHDIQRSYSGQYTCTATSEAGVDSKTTYINVLYTPSVAITGLTRHLAWEGESRNFTCEASGKPPPTLNWFRGGQYISNSDTYRMHTTKDSLNITSILQVTVGDNQRWVYGEYSCIGKNQFGYVTKTVNLDEAHVPDMPNNVTIVTETPSTVTIQAAAAAATADTPLVTAWRVRYHEADDGGGETAVTHPNAHANGINISGLNPDTTYIFYLMAMNIVGEGQAAKFKIKTPKSIQMDHFPADVPFDSDDSLDSKAANEDDHDVSGMKVDFIKEAAPGAPPPPAWQLYVAVGATLAAALLIALSVMAVFLRRRSKSRFEEHDTFTPIKHSNSTLVCIHGREVDNIQLQIRAGDTASPAAARAAAAAAAGRSPLPGKRRPGGGGGAEPPLQQVAWDQMMRHTALDASVGYRDSGEYRETELPPPPDFLLASAAEDDQGELYNDDGSYADILDGYHSEDNMDLYTPPSSYTGRPP